MLLFQSYSTRSAFKSPGKTKALFSEKVNTNFAKYRLLNSESYMDGLYMQLIIDFLIIYGYLCEC